MQKRQNDDIYDASEVAAKRSRYENALIAVPTGDEVSLANVQKSELKRTSGLSAPTIQLTGHEGAVYSLAFDPSGQYMASGSFDKQICKF